MKDVQKIIDEKVDLYMLKSSLMTGKEFRKALEEVAGVATQNGYLKKTLEICEQTALEKAKRILLRGKYKGVWGRRKLLEEQQIEKKDQFAEHEKLEAVRKEHTAYTEELKSLSKSIFTQLKQSIKIPELNLSPNDSKTMAKSIQNSTCTECKEVKICGFAISGEYGYKPVCVECFESYFSGGPKKIDFDYKGNGKLFSKS